MREFCLHLVGLRKAAPTTNNAKCFIRLFELKWLMQQKNLVYKHPLYEVTPPKKWTTKN